MKEAYLTKDWERSTPPKNYENYYKVLAYSLFGLWIITAAWGMVTYEKKESKQGITIAK